MYLIRLLPLSLSLHICNNSMNGDQIQTNKQELLELRDEINSTDPDIELLRPVNVSKSY